jgi:integrase
MTQVTHQDTNVSGQIGFLDQARLRPQQPTRYYDLIINTLIKLKNSGRCDSTIKATSYSLKQLSQHADLGNPEQVKTHIANVKTSNATKMKLCQAYNNYCKTNGIQWEKPHYKWERKIPLIPTTEAVNKVIAACGPDYATIFTILAETGLEAHELATMHRNDIDAERGIINATGCKGHNSRSFKLKDKTAEMLRTYLSRHPQQNPFPNSKYMGERWRKNRNRLATKLNDPQLKTATMRNLRHRFATMKYDQTKDSLLIKQLLGHKKLETTMFYTQLITFNENEEYTCKTASNIKEATDLIENGFQYITEMDGIKLFRKRK